MCPLHSRDLNPVDYAVSSRCTIRKFITVDQLKQAIVQEWSNLSQRFIDRSIDEWRRLLTGAVQPHGGHIGHTVSIINNVFVKFVKFCKMWRFAAYLPYIEVVEKGCHFLDHPLDLWR